MADPHLAKQADSSGATPPGIRLGIMQPYFLPYLGYFQLIQLCDQFVIYDDVQYTKKGWINRNRFLMNGQPTTFTINLVQSPEETSIRDKRIAPEFAKNRTKILSQLKAAYGRSPYFSEVFELAERCFLHPDDRLFEFLHHGLLCVLQYLEIATPIRVSSTLPIDPQLRGEERVLGICQAIGAAVYVNPQGGVELYSHDSFRTRGLELRFHHFLPQPYPQPAAEFVSHLSILDALFQCSKERLHELLRDYDLRLADDSASCPTH